MTTLKSLKHLKKILVHKYWVFYFARRMGIGWQGFWHDMSKFSPTEFFESVKYYTGTRSPIDVCKERNGYSSAWLHHKGRNPHHYEYWQDNFDKGGEPLPMPDKYIKEMLCDYLAAGRAYNGKDYTFRDEYNWWLQKRSKPLAMHPKQLNFIDQAMKFLGNWYGRATLCELTRKEWKGIRQKVDILLEINK